MSERLKRRLAAVRAQGKTGLSLFVTAGFPTPDATLPILQALANSGVDFVELGIPFSDPMADGPIIQEASQIALRNGVTLNGILETVRTFRRTSEMPVLLMGYANPVYRTGLETFLRRAADAGVDGLILPDLPLEELRPFISPAQKLGVDFVHLVAPNTPMARIHQIDSASTAFVYCVSYTGVTGQSRPLAPEITQFFTVLRRELTHPLFIGFGIRSYRDVQRLSAFCDGVIVGSAFIRELQRQRNRDWQEVAAEFVQTLRGEAARQIAGNP